MSTQQTVRQIVIKPLPGQPLRKGDFLPEGDRRSRILQAKLLPDGRYRLTLR